MNDPQPTFDQRAATWDDDPRKLARAELVAKSLRADRDFEGQAVLDFGAGTGLLGMHFVRWGADVTFVDPSVEMRKQVERKLRELEGPRSRSWVVASLQDVRDDFDLAVSLMALHHVDDPAHTIATLATRLKPGGRIALCDLEPEDGSFHDPGTTGVHFGFSRQQLGQWCQDAGLRDFCYGTVASVERDSDQGTRRYPLFLMEARRAT